MEMLIIRITILVVIIVAFLFAAFSLISLTLYLIQIYKLLKDDYGCKYARFVCFLPDDIRLVIKDDKVAKFVIDRYLNLFKRAIGFTGLFAVLVFLSMLLIRVVD